MLAFAFIGQLNDKQRVYERSWAIRKYCGSPRVPLASRALLVPPQGLHLLLGADKVVVNGSS